MNLLVRMRLGSMEMMFSFRPRFVDEGFKMLTLSFGVAVQNSLFIKFCFPTTEEGRSKRKTILISVRLISW